MWLGLLALLGVLLISVAAGGGRPLAVDLWVDEAVSGRGTAVAAVLTQLGSGSVLYPALLLSAAVLRRRGASWSQAVLPVGLFAAAQAVEAVAFVTLDRPRPGGGLATFSSGQAMAALLGWGLLARQHGARRAAWAGVAGASLVVGASRIVLGEHWASDVLAGWLVAGIVLLLHLHLRAATEPSRPDLHLAAPSGDGPTARWVTSRWMWAVTAAAALVPLVPLLTVQPSQRLNDLLVYVGAGTVAGAGADVYEFRTAFDMPFTYPPFAAVLSEPLSRIPPPLLHLLWTGATLLALVALARVGMRPVLARLGLPLTLTLLLISSPVRSHLRFGQIGIFLVLLVAADLLREHRARGLGVGLATAVKLTPAAYLPWLLVTRQTRTTRNALIAAAGATALGLLLLWPSAHEYLWRALWDSSRFGPNDIPGNQRVRGMLLRTTLDDHAAQIIWVLLAIILLAAATIGAHRLHMAGDRLAAVGVLAAASVAVSPISWVHHLVWLVLPISALAAAGRTCLAAAWSLILIVSLPSLGSAGLSSDSAGLSSDSGMDLLWNLIINMQGMTAVAAVLTLPLLLAPPRSRTTGAPDSANRADIASTTRG